MADITFGKVWSLDTAVGIVSTSQVCIHSVRVRFTTAGAGSCILATVRPDVTGGTHAVQEVLLDLKTTAASTATAYVLDREYFFGDQTFAGLQKTVSVNVDTIYVVTSNPR